MKRAIACGLFLASFLALLCVHHRLLKDLPENRVEMICDEQVDLPESLQKAVPLWETDRLVFRAPNLFTAQLAETALRQQGQAGTVLDYSWASKVLAQSETLWMGVGAILFLWLLFHLLWKQAGLELRRAKAALETQYWGAYWNDAGIRLLAKAIALALSLLLGVLLILYLKDFELTLPQTLLPHGSLFDLTHYCQWFEVTFPANILSPYGAALLDKPKTAYGLAALEIVTLTAFAVAVRPSGRRPANPRT